MPISEEKAQPQRRPWAVSALSLLLLLEALLLAGLGTLLWFYVESLEVWWQVPILHTYLNTREALALTAGGLTLWLLISALFFSRLLRWAWVTSLMAQGFLLFIAIYLYLNGAPAQLQAQREHSYLAYLLYGTLLYGAFMVIYLNHADVQQTLRRPAGRSSRRKRYEHE